MQGISGVPETLKIYFKFWRARTDGSLRSAEFPRRLPKKCVAFFGSQKPEGFLGRTEVRIQYK